MKKITVLILALMFVCSTAFAADVWQFRPKEVRKIGGNISIVVETIVNGDTYAGREITLDYEYVKDMSLADFLQAVKAEVLKAVQKDNLEFLVKRKLDDYMDTVIDL